MHLQTEFALQDRLIEAVMRAAFPCDLGDGIEVVHDVEALEIEMECDLEEAGAYSEAYERIEIAPEPNLWLASAEDLATARFTRVLDSSLVRDTLAETVPYPRIEATGGVIHTS